MHRINIQTIKINNIKLLNMPRHATIKSRNYVTANPVVATMLLPAVATANHGCLSEVNGLFAYATFIACKRIEVNICFTFLSHHVCLKNSLK
jgi:hypothetical protein